MKDTRETARYMHEIPYDSTPVPPEGQTHALMHEEKAKADKEEEARHKKHGNQVMAGGRMAGGLNGPR